MQIEYNISLKPFNTFGVNAVAKAFAPFSSEADLVSALQQSNDLPFILGGGSNLLLVNDLDKLVLHNRITGISELEIKDGEVLIELGAGVIWHDFVSWAVAKGYGGVENLALIPGTVGAAPIQNIGAYGVELNEVFHSLDTVDLSDGKVNSWDPEACAFGYRMSIFKQPEHKGRYCVTRVRLKLRTGGHIVNTSYGAIEEVLAKKHITEPGIDDVYRAVIEIRSSKLPDPKQLGNSGSFFKNPEVDSATFERLQNAFPDLVYYTLPGNMYKIPAGWMIERCGWKGKRIGDAGCHDRQALVLVNFGNATGRQIYDLAMQIRDSVLETFGIELQPEVNILL